MRLCVCVCVRVCDSKCMCMSVVCVYLLREHIKFRKLFPVLKWSMDDKFEMIWKEIFVIKSR